MAESEKVEKAAEVEKEAPPDPYEDLDPSERDAARDVDESWAKASARERLAFVKAANAAAKETQSLKSQLEEAKEALKGAKTPAAKEEAKDDISTLREQIKSLSEGMEKDRQERKAQEEANRRKAEVAEANRVYREALDGVIAADDELADDKDEAARFTKLFWGEYLSSHPTNIPKAFKAFIAAERERDEKRFGKKAGERLIEKVHGNRATRGESGRGKPPAKGPEYEIKAGDLASGVAADRIAKKYGWE